MTLTHFTTGTPFNAVRGGVNGNFSALREEVSLVAGRVPELVFGTFVGQGDSQNIELGFQPSVLLVCSQRGEFAWSGRTFGGLLTPDYPAGENLDSPAVQITETGFIVRGAVIDSSNCANITGRTYCYLAVRYPWAV